GIAEKGSAGHIDFGRHLPGARLSDMVADRVAVAHAAAPGRAAARIQQSFEPRRLAREVGTNQRGTSRGRGRTRHGRLQPNYRAAARPRSGDPTVPTLFAY